MAITKVWIEDGCIGCGLSEELCPQVFTVEDVARVNENVDFSLYEEEIKQAARECPVMVIEYEES